MKKELRLLKLCVGVGALLISSSHLAADASSRPEKPNVVLMYTDDLGWQDVKCYDVDEPSPFETPNIDALAKRGVLFRQAYSPAPTCAPSRCAMISGKHPARLQKTHVRGGTPPVAERAIDRIMAPWFSGRLPVEEVTIAEVLRGHGYRTGHSGKWHIAINHHSYPQPKDHGFDATSSGRGVNTRMQPHRLTGFATDAPNDPYRLDEAGIPRDEVTENAIRFMDTSKAEPFFLYYATWLVHYPIQSRSRALLEKYCEKMGMEFPTDPGYLPRNGEQKNPYYGAMVELLDAYVGHLLDYLETTDDPRWPGHKLIENTYVIFSSDNGGCTGAGETYTTNAPLSLGKSSAKEGGIRVPLIIAGPGVKQGVDTNVLANALDFYPTILSWTQAEQSSQVELDGCDLSALLSVDPTNASLVKDSSGTVRNTMIHHFPHGNTPQSTIRIDGYKLIHNYYGRFGNVHNPYPELELYQLYDEQGVRVDIEEAKNIADSMPEKVESMRKLLAAELESMDASLPYLNPLTTRQLVGKDLVCVPQKAERNGRVVSVSYQENGAKVVAGYLMYTRNGGHTDEEWDRTSAQLSGDGKLVAELPEGATHYLFNLIDENDFLVSYPQVEFNSTIRTKKLKFSSSALPAPQ
jgi:arylsulfatase A-like enzyme